MRKILGIGLVTILLFSCKNDTKKIKATENKVEKKEIVTSKTKVSDFEGSYILGTKESGYWVEVKIESLKNQDSCKIIVDSKMLKGRKCCKLNKNGALINDTIFIKLTDWKRPVTAIITKKDNKITFDAIEKETDDRFALMRCCGGGSLIGDYLKE